MFERTEYLEDNEKPMKVGIISLHKHQYSRKAVDFHLPCAIMIKGLMPSNNRCVVPPILNLWPESVIRPEDDHISLHLDKNHALCISKHVPSSDLKANICAS